MSRLRRLASMLATGPRHREADVHFHSGPEGHPAPRFDRDCNRPGLRVAAGHGHG